MVVGWQVDAATAVRVITSNSPDTVVIRSSDNTVRGGAKAKTFRRKGFRRFLELSLPVVHPAVLCSHEKPPENCKTEREALSFHLARFVPARALPTAGWRLLTAQQLWPERGFLMHESKSSAPARALKWAIFYPVTSLARPKLLANQRVLVLTVLGDAPHRTVPWKPRVPGYPPGSPRKNRYPGNRGPRGTPPGSKGEPAKIDTLIFPPQGEVAFRGIRG